MVKRVFSRRSTVLREKNWPSALDAAEEPARYSWYGISQPRSSDAEMHAANRAPVTLHSEATFSSFAPKSVLKEFSPKSQATDRRLY